MAELTFETARKLTGKALYDACVQAGVWEKGMNPDEALEALLDTFVDNPPEWAAEEETPEWAAEEEPETNPLWVWSWEE